MNFDKYLDQEGKSYNFDEFMDPILLVHDFEHFDSEPLSHENIMEKPKSKNQLVVIDLNRSLKKFNKLSKEKPYN